MSSVLSPFMRRLRGEWKTSVLTCALMALGVGGVTAIFSAAYGILWARLPFPDAARLFVIETEDPSTGLVRPVSYPDYRDLASSAALSDSAVAGPVRLTFTDATDDARSRVGEYVSGGYFELLGIAPLVGRRFTAKELDIAAPVASIMMISEAMWRERFASDRGVIGQSISTSGGVFSIVGVLPQRVNSLIGELCLECDPVDFLLPGSAASLVYPGLTQNRRQRWHYVIGQLRNGTTLAGARAELSTRAEASSIANPTTNRGLSVRVSALGDSWRAPLRPMLGTLALGAGLLLFVATVNVACLMLVQAERRSRNIAIRVAMGAKQRDLWRALLSELAALSVVATALGYLIALALIRSTVNIDLPGYVDLTVEWPMVLFAGVITLGVGVAGSLAPLLRARRSNVSAQLAAGNRAVVGGGLDRWGKPVVALEVAIVFMLVVGAALLVQSYSRFLAADPGFDPRNLHVFEINPDSPQYRDPKAQSRFIRALRAGLDSSALQGNVTVAAPNLPPRTFVRMAVQPLGSPLNTADGTLSVETHRVLPTFFQTLNIPLLEGRTFAEDSADVRETGVIVSRSLSTRLWPQEFAVGKHITLPGIGNEVGTVVGVARDVHYAGVLGGRSANYDLYLSLLQAPLGYMTVAARGQDRSTVAAVVRTALRQADSAVPILAQGEVTERFNTQGRDLESGAQLVGLFALVATMLGAGGIFGVIAVWLERRRPEIALRLALGAGPAEVRRLVLVQTALPISLGLGLGLVVSVVAAPLLQPLLFSVDGSDPRTLLIATLAIMVMSILVTLPIAWKASRTEMLRVFQQ